MDGMDGQYHDPLTIPTSVGRPLAVPTVRGNAGYDNTEYSEYVLVYLIDINMLEEGETVLRSKSHLPMAAVVAYHRELARPIDCATGSC